jgi:hypothetical protein
MRIRVSNEWWEMVCSLDPRPPKLRNLPSATHELPVTATRTTIDECSIVFNTQSNRGREMGTLVRDEGDRVTHFRWDETREHGTRAECAALAKSLYRPVIVFMNWVLSGQCTISVRSERSPLGYLSITKAAQELSSRRRVSRLLDICMPPLGGDETLKYHDLFT